MCFGQKKKKIIVNSELSVLCTEFFYCFNTVCQKFHLTLINSHLLCNKDLSYVLIGDSPAVNHLEVKRLKVLSWIFFFYLLQPAQTVCFNGLITHLSAGLKCQDSNNPQIISRWFCSNGSKKLFSRYLGSNRDLLRIRVGSLGKFWNLFGRSLCY